MFSLVSNTYPDAEEVLSRLWREALPWRTLDMVAQLDLAVKPLALTSLKKSYPGENEARLQRRFAGLLWGKELACKANVPLAGESQYAS